MWRMLAVLLVGMMVMAGGVDATAPAPASGITVPLQRRIYSSSAAERLPVEKKTKVCIFIDAAKRNCFMRQAGTFVPLDV